MSEQMQQLPPADWKPSTIGQVSECVLGGTPSTEVPRFWGGDIPWMASGDVHLRRIHEVPGRITALGLRSSNATLTSPPAVAVGLAGQGKTRGTVALTLCTLSTNQSIALLQANGRDLRTDYLFHNLDRRYEELRARSSGGGRGGLSKAILEAVPIDLPPLIDQQKISEILDTLDEAVHQTGAIVEKLNLVRDGLLHDLLTRGIDAHGELRPSHDVAPDLYQESPLGWRPRDWEICRVASVLAGIDAGKSPDCQDIPAKGDQWGVLKVGAVHPDGLKLHENKVIEESRLKNPAYLVRDGDLLLSRANTFELVGLVCYVTNHPERLMLSDKTLRLSVRPNRMTTPFLFWQMQHPKTRTQIEIAATGTSGSMKNISQGGVEQLWISRPLIDEQEEITKRLVAAASRCLDEQEKLSKMRELKRGLMDDLLTGQVRVTPLLAQ